MATTSRRKLQLTETRQFGSQTSNYEIPDLTILQTRSYANFLQADVPAASRVKDQGLEGVLNEVFPIESFDQTSRLEYVSYELEKPRYTPDECRQLRLTYGYPFRVRLRIVRGDNDPLEEDVYLGELPVMIGGGEFIINGAERVVVNQLHRSPGIDFMTKETDYDRKSYSSRIIPERGSWIELNITRKETISVQIDQSSKLPIMTLLRAMSPEISSDVDILRVFYKTYTIKIKNNVPETKLDGKIAVGVIKYPPKSAHADDIIVECGQTITKSKAEEICTAGIKSVEVMDGQRNKLLLNSLEEDKTKSHEEALMLIYKRLRPGNPPQLDKAKDLFREKFYDTNRYRLGRVGRFRMNRKLGMNVDLNEMVLNADDLVQAVLYLNRLWAGDTTVSVDDIDHLGNRRLRTIDELAADELRKGFLKLRRTAQDRLREDATPRNVINTKSISAAIEFFFGRGELSQVVDQTNPLSMLTHERRLSALGPGGLDRKRAGFEVRDVHSSHYGRICPIETPEGTNIGLISSLAIFAGVDEFGFLIAPYRRVEGGKITDQIDWLRADEEHEAKLVPADTKIERTAEAPLGQLVPDPVTGLVIARHRGDYEPMKVDQVEYIDVSPNQMIGVSAGLIPFLEHDDANRALMGSNMQRQAVPLLITEAPIVATGFEEAAARNSSLLVKARKSGKVTYADSKKIIIDDDDVYELRKFVGLNERTCQNQRPIVMPGQVVSAGETIADGASTDHGVLALGRNVLVAFMVWDGFNYEDAIIISEELVQNDTYTSLHIEEFDTEIRETRLGREEFTRDIPNVGDRALRNLDENGIVRVGTYVKPGDILVGKISPKNKTELTPEEKLLHAIFGRAGEDVKNESLEVPSGVEGIVIGANRFSNRTSLSDMERREYDVELAKVETEGNQRITEVFGAMVDEMENVLGVTIAGDDGESLVQEKDPKYVAEKAKTFSFPRMCEDMGVKRHTPEWARLEEIYMARKHKVEEAIDAKERIKNSMACGDQLKRGVLQMVKIYIAAKRVISVGDKMAGRHGNKGVIAKILPKEDMPFMEDGTPIQIMLNPLGVPSRMNVGQILETHLGWAAAKLGYKAVTPVFDGATEGQINEELASAGLPSHGKVRLYDGRTGEPFGQETTVGYIYMLKLHHLVDDKVHARSTGPYSLITQQPLGGKARFGGQRFGEMEVWALEAYGAAYTLQELLTVKSDDVEGRTKIYESMVKGENTLEAGTPASFDVLINEIKGLALDMDLVPSGGKKLNFAGDLARY
ncbi:MAG: DNA-directed RNA polymerase subunit beta [Planctomycetia bacterium]|nr:DNA-directed RNA polymerase subunit beta [Planctomycetia bacterium]